MNYRIHMVGVLICALALGACGPRANIPPRPSEPLPGALAPSDPAALLARSLAPVLFLQSDERFPLERVVAVVHPDRQIIAYHLLWRDDVHGSWIPFTVPTDQEIVWVAYDSTAAPVTLWTFWHGKILFTPWADRGTPAVNVQWGKHGSLPRGLIESDLPVTAKLNAFYLFAWLGLPDTWLGHLTRPGPVCFCRSYGRYRQFTRPLALGDRIDLVARDADPTEILAAVFGRPYSRKPHWPAASP